MVRVILSVKKVLEKRFSIPKSIFSLALIITFLFIPLSTSASTPNNTTQIRNDNLDIIEKIVFSTTDFISFSLKTITKETSHLLASAVTSVGSKIDGFFYSVADSVASIFNKKESIPSSPTIVEKQDTRATTTTTIVNNINNPTKTEKIYVANNTTTVDDSIYSRVNNLENIVSNIPLQTPVTPDVSKNFLTRQVDTVYTSIGRSISDTSDTLTASINAILTNGTLATPTFTGTTTADILSLNDLTVNDVITLASVSPSVTTNKLYQNSGSLYWAGNVIGGATTGNWTTDGTNVYRATGNVGIGTTSPYAKLSVVGPVVAEYFHATSTTATSTFAGGLIAGNNSAFVVNQGATANSLYVAGNGNVGIGVNNPSALLHLYAPTGAVDATLLKLDRLTLTGSQQSFINWNVGSFPMGYIGSGLPTTGDGSFMTFGTAGSGFVNTERMRIDREGNVGIGTSTPYAKLSVEHLSTTGTVIGADALTGFTGNLLDLKVASSSKFTVDASGNVVTGGTLTPGGLGLNMLLTSNASGVIVSSSTPTAAAYLATSTTATSTFFGGLIAGNNSAFVVNQGATANSLYVAGNGNVGVGTASPSSLLSLQGSNPAITITPTNGNQRAFTITANGSQLVINSLDASGSLIFQTAGTQRTALSATANTFGDGVTGSGLITSTKSGSGVLLDIQRDSYGGMELSVAGGGPYGSGGNLRHQITNGATFYTIEDTTGTDFFRWASSTNNVSFMGGYGAVGNVGIGSTSPAAKLSITGSGLTTGKAFEITDSANSPKFTVLDNGNVTSNGDVGIGVSPSYRFHVVGPTTGATTAYIIRDAQSAGGGPVMEIVDNSSNTLGNNSSSFTITRNSSPANNFSTPKTAMRIDTTSRVGAIYTTTTATNNDNSNFGARFSGSVGTNFNQNNDWRAAVIDGSDLRSLANTGQYIGLQVMPTINQTGSANGPYTGLQVNVTQTAFLGTDGRLFDVKLGGNSKFLVKNDGNVGIGTTAPGQKLSVSGNVALTLGSDIRFRGDTDANWAIGNDIVADTGGMLTSNTLQLKTGPGAGQGVQILNSGSTVPVFEVEALTGKTYISGNVGIGTTSPLYKLSVQNTSEGNTFQIYDTDGNCLLDPDSGAITTTCSSDARLKTNIENAGSALSYFSDIQIRDYNVIASGERRTGVVAQELLTSHPELVHMGSDGYYGVSEINSWKLIKGIQELDEKSSILNLALTSATSSIASSIAEINTRLSTSTITSLVTLPTMSTIDLDEIASTTADTLFSSESFIGRIASSVKNLISSTGDWVIAKITATTGYFTNLFADKVITKELCLDDVCVTKNELQALLANMHASTTQAVVTTTTEIATTTPISEGEDSISDNVGTGTSTPPLIIPIVLPPVIVDLQEVSTTTASTTETGQDSTTDNVGTGTTIPEIATTTPAGGDSTSDNVGIETTVPEVIIETLPAPVTTDKGEDSTSDNVGTGNTVPEVIIETPPPVEVPVVPPAEPSVIVPSDTPITP